MHQITRIYFSWDCQQRLPRLAASQPDYFTQVWLGVWKNLAEMRDLRELRVEILLSEWTRPPGKEAWEQEEGRIMQSLDEIRRRSLKSFEVIGLLFEVKTK